MGMLDAAPATPKVPWCEETKDKVHESIWEYCKRLESRYWMPRVKLWEMYIRMYGDDGTLSLLPSQHRVVLSPTVRQKHLQMNIARSLSDTAAAKIGQARPRPFFLTDGGSWSLQEKATALQRLNDGVFDECDLYLLGARVQLDSVILGTGCLKLFEEHGQIRAERVLISEILVDEALCYYGPPREIFQRKEVPRRSLEALYKSKAKRALLKGAEIVNDVDGNATDLVVVYEAWHLPDGPIEPDEDGVSYVGRHVICVSTGTLLDEDYDKPYFPLLFIHWQAPIIGFYGSGIPAQVFGQQVEINRTLMTISRAHKLHGTARMMVPEGSKVNPLHVDDEIGTILFYDGVEVPQIMAQQILSPEIYQHLENQYRKAFELTGLSSLSAFAQKPAGIDSGAALRELADTQADRLAPKSQDYDRLFLQATRVVVDLCRNIYKRDGKFRASTVDQGELHTVDFREVADLVEKNEFKLQLFAANFLGRTPSAKIEDAEKLINGLKLPPQQVARLMDFPDVKSVLAELMTADDTYRKQVQKLLRKGKYVEPEVFDALQVGLPIYRDAYLRAREDGVPEETLQKFRDWIERATEILDEQEPQAPVVPVVGGAPTTAPPTLPQDAQAPPMPAAA